MASRRTRCSAWPARATAAERDARSRRRRSTRTAAIAWMTRRTCLALRNRPDAAIEALERAMPAKPDRSDRLSQLHLAWRSRISPPAATRRRSNGPTVRCTTKPRLITAMRLKRQPVRPSWPARRGARRTRSQLLRDRPAADRSLAIVRRDEPRDVARKSSNSSSRAFAAPACRRNDPGSFRQGDALGFDKAAEALVDRVPIDDIDPVRQVAFLERLAQRRGLV